MQNKIEYIKKLEGWLDATKPLNEVERLAELKSFNILDTKPTEQFDNITKLMCSLLGTKIGLVSLIDDDRQWFKSSCGLSATETPRDQAFCTHAIWQEEVMVVLDTHEDERFMNNPLVTGAPFIRFYAGAPLITPNGFKLGTLCAIDDKPRKVFTDSEYFTISSLSKLVIDEMRLHLLLSRQKSEGK